jgi:hypothetical protein
MDLLHDILRDVKYEEIRELAAGNPATDSSIPPPNGSSPWNLLSRELRDEVYRHAYGRRSGWLKILFKAEINLYNKLARSTWKKGAKRCKVRDRSPRVCIYISFATLAFHRHVEQASLFRSVA